MVKMGPVPMSIKLLLNHPPMLNPQKMFKLTRGKFRIGNLRASPKRRKGPR